MIYIHRNTRLSEAPSFGKPVILYDADSKGAVNYLNLAKEILQKNNMTLTQLKDGQLSGTDGELMVYKIYFDGFKGLDYSGAAAQSIILMLLVVGLTVVQFRFLENRVHYN